MGRSSLKRFLVVILAACAGIAAAPQRSAADTCGISDRGTLWIDFADGSVPFWQLFARPGVTAAAANFIYPPQLRALGAKTIYWDMYLRRRVGTPNEPFDPSVVIDRANRLYDAAAMSTGCSRPMIAENELNGSSSITPWTAANAQYRRDVLLYVKTLAGRGARPVLLVGQPYTGDEAGDWWRQVSNYADIVRESYFAAPRIAKLGPFDGSRTLREFFRRRVDEFTSAGIPPRRLGLMLGFQTTPGQGGREQAPSQSWYEVTKLQTFAAQEVARELNLHSVWSWGWGVWSKGEDDPDKATAACVYLWTRDPKLCAAQAMAGPGFNASRTEGQLIFAPGVRCTLQGRPVRSAAISELSPVTGDQQVAFTAVFARVAASLSAEVKPGRIAAAEKAVTANLGGYASYRAALARSRASVGVARGVIEDELRKAQIEARLRVPNPPAVDIQAYYASYGSTRARLVETKSPVTWLGNRMRGYALESNAPPQLFDIPQNRWVSVRTMLGTYKVRAVEPVVPLAALPLGLARMPVSVALKGQARDQSYESWLLFRERALVEQATCRKDELPAAGVVPLTDYLPYLAAE